MPSLSTLLKYVAGLFVQTGSAADYTAVGGVLYVSTTQVVVPSGLITVLSSYDIPANALAVNGQSIWFETGGSAANNANLKTITITLSGGLIYTYPIATGAGRVWHIRGRIIRTGASQVKYIIYGIGQSDDTDVEIALKTETLTSASTLSIRGDGSVAGDITGEYLMVGWDANNT